MLKKVVPRETCKGNMGTLQFSLSISTMYCIQYDIPRLMLLALCFVLNTFIGGRVALQDDPLKDNGRPKRLVPVNISDSLFIVN